VSSIGDVTGTLRTLADEYVADFSGELEQGNLVGTLEVSGELEGDWAAPADDLPVP
jgi:hypothetical protein